MAVPRVFDGDCLYTLYKLAMQRLRSGLTLARPPVSASSLIGRDRELELVGQLIYSHRLVTLTGAGGSGKTRLALEALNRLEGAFADGILWVELASLQDATLIPRQVLSLLGVREEASRSATETLLERLHNLTLLLALDNCEHLVDGCAELAEMLLRHCPSLKLLTTSREALGIMGEKVWLVPLLSLPEEACNDPDALLASDAARLFVERASAVSSDFQLTPDNVHAVAAICRELDGIPLAIELAAARSNVLTLRQIEERLRRCFTLLSSGKRRMLPRHQTLEAAIDWSYQLLTPAEAALFRRLSVFPGSFTLEAVEAVCSDDQIGADQLLDLLSALVNKSMVVTLAGAGRYRLLETVRRFAAIRLSEAGEVTELHDRHLDYFLEMAEAAAPRIFAGPGDLGQIDLLEHEVDNLRAATDWGQADPGRMDRGLRLCVALHWFWFARGFFGEARRRLGQAETAAAASMDPLVRSKALTALAYFAFWQGDNLAARAPVEKGVEILEGLDDPFWHAYALNGLAMVHTLEGNPVAADPIFQKALAVAEPLGKTVLLPFILFFRGTAAQDRGDYQQALDCFQEGTRLGRELGHRAAIAHPLSKLAGALLRQNDYPAASRCLVESLTIHLGIDDRMGLAMGLEGMSRIAVELDQSERAIRILAGTDHLREGLAAPLSPHDRQEKNQLIAALRKRVGESEFQRLQEEGRSMNLEELVRHAVDPAFFPSEWMSEDETTPTEGPNQPAVEASKPPSEVLQLLALGASRLTLNSRPLVCPKKSREMLIYLLCHPQGCSKEEIGLALWPDASPEQLRNVFHVTLSRLRSALGSGSWILTNGKYRINPDLNWECDAAAFERKINFALQALRGGDDAVEDMQRALRLYGGDFLEGESLGDWMFQWRDRLKNLYLEGLTVSGSWLMKHARFPEAAGVFEKLLLADALDEAAARQLMICLAQSGQRSQALRIYRQLVQNLDRELECDPEPETVALFEKLRSRK